VGSTVRCFPNASQSSRVLITGANAGIGKELAKRMAGDARVSAVYLGCRSRAKAEMALQELQAATCRSIFQVLPTVRAAVASLDEPIDVLCLNARGLAVLARNGAMISSCSKTGQASSIATQELAQG
jgi:NAD(P)-dependent dehydrogenase (short-subunit alcohol dehydrogenase family)